MGCKFLNQTQPAITFKYRFFLDFSTLIKSRVGDDGVVAILQYRLSDLYLTDRKETMTIYPHSSPHLQIWPSLVHPFLSQDKLLIQMPLDVPWGSLQRGVAVVAS